MSILDDAIREHLELKRAHGADDSELKKLEDEAFGPPQRPDEVDPFAEAPTEFLATPGETPAPMPEVGDESARSGRRPNIADLQEAPPASSEPGPEGAPLFTDAEGAPVSAEEGLAPAPDAPPPSPSDAAELAPPPPAGEAPVTGPPAPPAAEPSGDALAAEPDSAAGGLFDADASAATEEPVEAAPSATDATTPAEGPGSAAAEPTADAGASDAPLDAAPAPESSATEEQPAAEGEIAPDAGPNTEERHAIADQPTQMFDVQAHVDAEAEADAPTDAAPADEAPAAEEPVQQPLDTRGPDAEVAGHPPGESAPAEEESAEFDFFNEQRLSDELDQALEAPLPPTDEHIAMPQYGEPPPPAQGGIFDFESEGATYEEDPSEEVLRRHDTPAPEPASEEYEPPSEEVEPPSEERPRAAAEPDSEEVPYAFDPDTGHEDVLEDRPKFLDDSDDDDLWFEQKPPKDFDLD
jgi:hypothetical protein